MPGGPAETGGGIGANAPKNKFTGVLMTSFAAFGGILFGYDTGTINGIKDMKDWLRTFGAPTTDLTHHKFGYAITSSQESLVVSILSAGTFFGALLGSPVADILGRKWGIILACLVFSVGVAMQTASTSIPLFVVGRVVAGLGVGLVSCLVPMYQSECSPKWIRGAVVGAYQWAITIGLLLSAVVNNATQSRDNHSAYRIPIAIQFVWASVLSFGMVWLPESPRWLIKRGRDKAAAHALGRLLGLKPEDPEVEAELDDIRTNLAEEQRIGETGYIDCFKPGPNKLPLRTLTGIFIQAWQQLTGINFIFYFGTSIFQNAGISKPFLITVATNIVNVFMTLPGMWGVERFGRRRLLLVGAIGMCVCEFLIAIIGVTISVQNTSGQKALVAFVCVYIAFFASTWGPIAWIVTGEIFPLAVRAKAMSLSVASNWLWNFGIGYATPYLVNVAPGSAGLQSKVFFIWGSTCACCWVFTYFCVPETKGLSLEQIDIMYQHTTPVRSLEYRRQLIANNVHSSDPTSFEKLDGKQVDEKQVDDQSSKDNKVENDEKV
jgi:sugar porter (SP) family MFS transporter